MSAAEAAVRDTDWRDWCRDENIRCRAMLRDALVQMGLGCDESFTNFVLVRFDSPQAAGACDAALKDAGIIVRRVGGYQLPEALRVTVGTEDDCRRVIDVVARFMGVRA